MEQPKGSMQVIVVILWFLFGSTTRDELSQFSSSKAEIQKNQVVQCHLSAITAMLNCIILNQFVQLQAVSNFVDFGPLVKAAKGETVPKNELKNALIKAIDILMSKIDSNDGSTGALNATRLLLQCDVQTSDDIA
ncbi:MAG: hypothetical protein WCF23_06900 [Candidatus Nitrosopolaris sp.]